MSKKSDGLHKKTFELSNEGSLLWKAIPYSGTPEGGLVTMKSSSNFDVLPNCIFLFQERQTFVIFLIVFLSVFSIPCNRS